MKLQQQQAAAADDEATDDEAADYKAAAAAATKAAAVAKIEYKDCTHNWHSFSHCTFSENRETMETTSNVCYFGCLKVRFIRNQRIF